MNDHSTSKKIAMGLMVLTVFALLVGLFNAINSQSAKGDLAVKDEKEGSFLSVLNSSGKKSHLMLIDLAGPIMMDPPQQGGLFSSDSVAVTARKALDQAAEDDSVKGVLIRINSPGGTVGMSQELNAAVKRVREKKPVIASFGDMAASGGYYTACAADEIISNPGTLTASIGVIISTMNLKGLFTDKLGLKAVTIKSGKFKDILSPYRDPVPAEIALIQAMIDDSYKDFLAEVVDGRTRNMTDEKAKAERTEKIKAVADGRVVTGNQAKEVGLVDDIGDLDFAHKRLDKMAKERFKIKGKDELPLKEYTESGGLLDMLGLSAKLGLKPAAAQHNTALDVLVPFSMSHPNQPLWIAE